MITTTVSSSPVSTVEIKGWCGFRDRNAHGLTEAQAREIISKLRQGIGPDLDSLIARVGAMRVRNTKIICYLKTPSLSSCKQIRGAMNAFIEKENIKLEPQGTTEQLATMKAKYITSEWYPFHQVYAHESGTDSPSNNNIWSSGGNN